MLPRFRSSLFGASGCRSRFIVQFRPTGAVDLLNMGGERCGLTTALRWDAAMPQLRRRVRGFRSHAHSVLFASEPRKSRIKGTGIIYHNRQSRVQPSERLQSIYRRHKKVSVTAQKYIYTQPLLNLAHVRRARFHRLIKPTNSFWRSRCLLVCSRSSTFLRSYTMSFVLPK